MISKRSCKIMNFRVFKPIIIFSVLLTLLLILPTSISAYPYSNTYNFHAFYSLTKPSKEYLNSDYYFSRSLYQPGMYRTFEFPNGMISQYNAKQNTPLYRPSRNSLYSTPYLGQASVIYKPFGSNYLPKYYQPYLNSRSYSRQHPYNYNQRLTPRPYMSSRNYFY